jgi:HSP20 family protein
MKVMKPLNPLGVARRDVDTMFDRMFRWPLLPEMLPAKAEALWEPALDLSETDREVIVRLEVPGFHKENLDVKFENELLTISGHREFRNEMKGEEFLWTEREEGRFVRTLRIPSMVDPVKVEALYENGLLTVKLPKVDPTPKAKIAIK